VLQAARLHICTCFSLQAGVLFVGLRAFEFVAKKKKRPALSRWHDDYAPKFSEYMKGKGLA